MINPKYKIPLLLIVINSLWFSSNLSAQNKLNYIDIDKLSYQYYTEQKWDELIDLGKESLKKGIDFYYLQYRMGVAYYSKKRYRRAIPFLENVIKLTPNDAIAKEYLYYSYLLGSRSEDAREQLLSLEKDHIKSIEYYQTNNLFNNLGLEYKFYTFEDFAVSDKVNSEITQHKRNSLNYFSADLFNYSENKSMYYFNFSVLSGKNSVYNIEVSPDVIDENLKQYQFYFLWNKHISKGTNFKVGITYMRETINWLNSNNRSSSLYNGSANNWVAFISLSKTIKNVEFSLGTSASSINTDIQVQPFISLDYYPFGNTKLFTSTSVIYQYNPIDNDKNNIILKQSIGSYLSSKFSINIFGLYGKVNNFVDNNGLSIYNSLDAIDYWYGASANYYFNKNTQVYLHLRNDGQTNNYTVNNETKEISYEAKSALLGVRFNF